jgi:hypothetical protein
MTAYAIIEDHSELSGVGVIEHQEIDDHISGSSFLLLSGSSYVSPTARQLSLGYGITGSDTGPGGTYTISIDTGSFGGASSGAEYVVLSPDPSIPNARKIITGSGIILQDDSLNKTITVAVNPLYIQSLFVWNEIPEGANDGTNVTYSLAATPSTSQSLMFFVNGVLQFQNGSGDYQLSGSVITMSYMPRSGSNLLASYPRS